MYTYIYVYKYVYTLRLVLNIYIYIYIIYIFKTSHRVYFKMLTVMFYLVAVEKVALTNV